MLTVNEINRAIVLEQFTNTELSMIIEAVQIARSNLTRKNRRSLVIGTHVQFTHTRTGQQIAGVVEKVAIKFITVKTGGALWRVPANMLTRVTSSA